MELNFDDSDDKYKISRRKLLSTKIGTRLLCKKSHEIGITEGKTYVVFDDYYTYGVIKNDEDESIHVCIDYFDIIEDRNEKRLD